MLGGLAPWIKASKTMQNNAKQGQIAQFHRVASMFCEVSPQRFLLQTRLLSGACRGRAHGLWLLLPLHWLRLWALRRSSRRAGSRVLCEGGLCADGLLLYDALLIKEMLSN